MPPTPEPPASLLVRSARALLWLVLAVGLLGASLLVTWQAWGAVDFGYRYWHNAIGIGAAIEQYAPQNHYRDHFAATTLDERARLFGAIVDAINGATKKLAGLRYHGPNGRVLGYLLRPPEVQHLTDVARLIGWFKILAIAGTVLAIAIAGLAIARRWPLPRLRAFAGGTALLGAALALILMLFGPTTVFYTLHTWIFPPGHEWFFYYQDSLMTTMMYAPVLFAAIATEWAATALPLFALLLAAQRHVHRRFAAR